MMVIVGLTGSIGMGKSALAARLRERGLPVFDADAEVHRLYAAEAAPAIEKAFPDTTTNGTVDRRRLAAALAREPDGFARLEAIVHPLVRAAERAFLRAAERQGATIAVMEIPLLFETGTDAFVDTVILASAPASVQRERVLQRPGMTEAKLDILLARQTSDDVKRAKAEFVVDTSLSLAETLAKLDAIADSLLVREGIALDRHWR